VNSREQKILGQLAGKDEVAVTELSRMLGVTDVTVRSDLNRLADLGKVARTHGGARLIEERIRQEYSFQTRKSLNSVKKQKIGELAASFIEPMDCVLFDSSSTVLAMARALVKKDDIKEVTVIPTGIWTAIELMSCQNINVLLPAGYLRHTTGSITGLPTNNFYKELIIKKAFLGAWGISFEKGLTDTHLLEVELKKLIVSKTEDIIILADGSKFHQMGLAAYADIKQISKIITDPSASPDEIKKMRKAGIEVLIAS